MGGGQLRSHSEAVALGGKLCWPGAVVYPALLGASSVPEQRPRLPAWYRRAGLIPEQALCVQAHPSPVWNFALPGM